MTTTAITPIEFNTERILTTQILDENYETNSQVITNSFNRNKTRYILNNHYYCPEGEEFKEFRAANQIELSQNINKLYLWAERVI